MASLTIKGIPDELLDRLRRQAAQHRRSLNGEVLHLIERSLGCTPIDAEAAIRRIGRLQERAPLPPLDDRLLEEAIDEGRP